MSYIDTHPELHIARYRGGVKLLDAKTCQSQSSCSYDTGKTVADAFGLSLNVGFLNLENRVENLNVHSANTLGFAGANEAIGISMQDIATKESAKTVEFCNKQATQSQSPQIFEQHILKNDNVSIDRLQFIVPWYSERNQVVGVFGCNLVIGVHPLAESLMEITKLGFMHASPNLLPGVQTYNVYLTKRQSDILYHTTRGLTAKRIAKHLNISFRTVESHLENIKSKFEVTTKSELIEKAMSTLVD